MGSSLLRGGNVYTSVDPFATAMLIIDGVVRWVGSDAGADVHQDSVDEIIELHGALVTPAFVDAHVHTTAYGLQITGLDLSHSMSSQDILLSIRTALATQARITASTDQSTDQSAARSTDDSAELIWGQGWDESAWTRRQFPTLSDLDAAAEGRPLYLSRVDAHSAFISTSMMDRVPGIRHMPGWDPQGYVTQQAHSAARAAAFAGLSQHQRRIAQDATLQLAASMGVASIHEMAGPTISSADDLRFLLDWTRQTVGVEVLGYWGALGEWETASELGALGCAGDLFVDGSLGSHTACLRQPYADVTTTGVHYIDVEAVTQHIIEGSLKDMQAGFHVIGDGALDIVTRAFSDAATTVDPAIIRKARHRLEHAEMLDEQHIALCSDLDIALSMQPLFDAVWGAPGGMYSTRVGSDRAREMNPFSKVTRAGVTLALGSDAPVTPLDPWASVRAAAFPHNPDSGISVRAAFAAHTRGGRRAARQDASEPGILREGVPATYAIWEVGELVVQAPDARLAAWSTDARSGTPGLPDLAPDAPAPQCLRTVRAGEIIYDSGAW